MCKSIRYWKVGLKFIICCNYGRRLIQNSPTALIQQILNTVGCMKNSHSRRAREIRVSQHAEFLGILPDSKEILL